MQAPTVELKGKDLTDFQLIVQLGAGSYDTVQYRTVEQTIWGKAKVADCK